MQTLSIHADQGECIPIYVFSSYYKPNVHYANVTWESWRFKSPKKASIVVIEYQTIVMTGGLVYIYNLFI